MFGRLIRKLKAAIEKGFKNPDPGPQEELISPDLRQNLDRIGAILSQSPDVVIRQFTICIDNGWPAAIIYIDELADKKTINDHILRPLMVDTVKITAEKTGPLVKDLRWIEDHLISVNELSRSSTLDQVVAAVIKGDTALLVQGFTNGLQISSKGWEKRALSEPEVEVVLKGPRDGFIENLRTNTALIRRKIAHPDLTFEPMRIGRKTRTDLFIAYIRGIAREDLVAEVRRRIERIDTDSVLAAANVSEFIEDAPFSIFPTTAFTERPDVAAAKLLDGRIAIIIDGTPTVYTVPALFIEGFQSPDDYHLRPYYATLIRWVRYLAFSLTVFLPALYVAMAS
ncbi:MAG: spore germination protein, partial [Bacillota bacterium]